MTNALTALAAHEAALRATTARVQSSWDAQGTAIVGTVFRLGRDSYVRPLAEQVTRTADALGEGALRLHNLLAQLD
jgi:hypothetical protein